MAERSRNKSKQAIHRLPSTGVEQADLLDFLNDSYEGFEMSSEDQYGFLSEESQNLSTNMSSLQDSSAISDPFLDADFQREAPLQMVPQTAFAGLNIGNEDVKDENDLLHISLDDLMPPGSPCDLSVSSPENSKQESSSSPNLTLPAPPAGKTGKGKRKITPMRQERNRDSARKFRARRKQYLQNLEDEVRRARQNSQQLQERLAKAEEELAKTTNELLITSTNLSLASKEVNQREEEKQAMKEQVEKLQAELENIREAAEHANVQVHMNRNAFRPALHNNNISSPSSLRPVGTTTPAPNLLPSMLKRSLSEEAEPAHVDMEHEQVASASNNNSNKRARVHAENAPVAELPPLSPMSIIMLVSTPQFRALALMLIAAIVFTNAYGIGMNVALGHVSLSDLQERWVLAASAADTAVPSSASQMSTNTALPDTETQSVSSSSSSTSWVSPNHLPPTPQSPPTTPPAPSAVGDEEDLFFGPEEHFNVHLAQLFSSTAQTAVFGFLLMSMYDPMQEKFKPYLVAL